MSPLDIDSLGIVSSYLNSNEKKGLVQALPEDAPVLKKQDWRLRAALDPNIQRNSYLKAYGMTRLKQDPSFLNSIIPSIWKILFRSEKKS